MKRRIKLAAFYIVCGYTLDICVYLRIAWRLNSGDTDVLPMAFVWLAISCFRNSVIIIKLAIYIYKTISGEHMSA